MKVVSVAFDSGLASAVNMVEMVVWRSHQDHDNCDRNTGDNNFRFGIVKICNGFEKFRLGLRVGKICLWFPAGGRCSTGIGSSNS
ncbi:hypothetical protein OROHE_008277 [Orobanche hederae]